ncbi:DUF1311 domain-containing protein [Roseibium sp. CAU 1637]|uniref:DUF1311 domain-containing protein n=1 Tax=Roseibium limicola TaxID=2816037 RepID=A0A939J3F7_9HYPH|nr:lysozyme inhibitor LprI family protein [Roseibium limicola]MBO0343655.1 DUF1311 domain-containing protein [Roseibium limicola]
MTARHYLRLAFCASTLGLSGVPALAQSCENPITTRDMIECAQLQLNLVDGDLNRVYQGLKASTDKTGQLKLRDAQRGWIAYRDAECIRRADMARGGTVAPVLHTECLVSLTATRVMELSTNPLTGEAN